MVTQMRSYRGVRRHGLRGRVGLFRGIVLDERDGEVIVARSPRLAGVIAQLLNGDELPRRQVEDPSRIPAYAVSPGGGPGKQHLFLVVGVESTVRNKSALGEGVIARSINRSLAEEVVRKLNEIDPRGRPRVMRGMGWW